MFREGQASVHRLARLAGPERSGLDSLHKVRDGWMGGRSDTVLTPELCGRLGRTGRFERHTFDRGS
jgi:hypothetical protein